MAATEIGGEQAVGMSKDLVNEVEGRVSALLDVVAPPT
jgi:hypothetical protein